MYFALPLVNRYIFTAHIAQDDLDISAILDDEDIPIMWDTDEYHSDHDDEGDVARLSPQVGSIHESQASDINDVSGDHVHSQPQVLTLIPI